MVVVARDATGVEARGRRHRWRAEPAADGAVRIDHAGHGEAPRRVDLDVPGLTRCMTRLFAEDPAAADQFATLLAELSGHGRVEDEPAVRSIVRSTLPLLAPQPPWPAPALPTCLATPVHLAFRAPTPREAAQRLWPGGATRPVIAALARWLCDPQEDGRLPAARGTESLLDVFVVSLAHAVGPLLEPDHVVRVLARPRHPAERVEPLDEAEGTGLRLLFGRLPPRRIVALCREAIEDPAARQRLRHASRHATEPLDRRVRNWESVAVHWVLQGPGPTPTPQPVPAPLPDPMVDDGLTLHRVTTQARLVELSRTMHNCLDTYGTRLGGRDRIVEFRRDGVPVYAAHLHNRRIITLEAPGNRRPPAHELPRLRTMLHDRDLIGGPPPGPIGHAGAPAPRRPGGHLREEELGRVPLSVQALATLLVARSVPAGATLDHDTTDWCELAAGLWCLGSVPTLPEPTRPATRQVMLDIAAPLAAGAQPRRGQPPGPELRVVEQRRLRARAVDHRPGWWACLVMADVLSRPVTP